MGTKEALVLETWSQVTNICSEAELNSNEISGLTQQIANLTIEKNLRNFDCLSFVFPNTNDELYDLNVMEHILEET